MEIQSVDNRELFFAREPSAVAITIPVYINFVGKGTATIGKDGNVVFRCGSEE
jgi:hypothetical protein